MTSEINRRLVASFMQFLTDELNNSDLSGDSKESIEGNSIQGNLFIVNQVILFLI